MIKNQTLHDVSQPQRLLEKQRKARFYPAFHLAPPTGWMNDPNGLAYCDGLYHVFYQHHPYDEHWGPMHWGHMTSHDLVHWQHQPIALAPGNAFDKDGCFSGCAVNDNGVLTLIYTGHVWLQGVGNDGAIRQVQCIATSEDGLHFTKHGVIVIPPDGIMHFRDPKVWKQNGRWFMVVGARDANDRGQVLLYSGTSLFQWRLEGVLAKADRWLGYMWECPDFFPLGDKYLLMFSPQGMTPEGYRYRNRFQSGYILGRWQPDHPFTLEQHFQELDAGHDFYAPQSFVTADGRRVLFGWMDMWESDRPTQADGWAGCLTLPRELTLDAQGRVRMMPVRELQALRREAHSLPAFSLSNQRRRLGISALQAEIHLTWDIQNSHAERFGIEIAISDDRRYVTRFYVDTQSRRLVLDRSQSGLGVGGYRSVVLPDGDSLDLQIFVDRSSVEIFVNQGETCLTSRIYPPTEGRGIALYAENGEAYCLAFNHWQMASIYPEQ